MAPVNLYRNRANQGRFVLRIKLCDSLHRGRKSAIRWRIERIGNASSDPNGPMQLILAVCVTNQVAPDPTDSEQGLLADIKVSGRPMAAGGVRPRPGRTAHISPHAIASGTSDFSPSDNAALAYPAMIRLPRFGSQPQSGLSGLGISGTWSSAKPTRACVPPAGESNARIPTRNRKSPAQAPWPTPPESSWRRPCQTKIKSPSGPSGRHRELIRQKEAAAAG